jgi:outer membrane protein OmpA-like peptidoglycan-associated protein
MSLHDPAPSRIRHFSRKQTGNKSAPEETWLLAYIKKNPFQSGAALATLYGVLVIFAYHFHIEYFPSFDLKSLASTVFAAAYTALCTLFVFSLSLFAPAYVIGTWGLDEQLGNEQKHGKTLQMQIFECFFLAFIIFLSICGVFFVIVDQGLSSWYLLFALPVVTILWIVVAYFLKKWLARAGQAGQSSCEEKETEGPDGDAAIALVRESTAEAAVVLAKSDPAVEHEAGKQRRAGLLTWSRVSFIFMMTCVAAMELLSMVILFNMLRDSPYAENTDDGLANLFGGLAWSGLILHAIGGYLVSAWRIPNLNPKHRLFSCITAFAAPVVVSLFLNNPALFFVLTAMTTKYGNFRAGEMTVTNTACRIIENGGEKLCVQQGDGMNKLCNVHVLSRIGTESYLLVSYPGKRRLAEEAEPNAAPSAKDDGGASQKKVDEKEIDATRWVLDIYLPSKEILGMRVDTTVRRFRKSRIVNGLGKGVSVCEGNPPAAPPARSAPPQKPTERTARLSLKTELFEFNKYVLKADGNALLQKFAQDLAATDASTMTIKVIGHTDSIGKPNYNLQLSQMRAFTVADYLQSYLKKPPHVIKQLDIDIKGVGPLQPKVADLNCPGRGAEKKRIDCLEPNRRVEVAATWEVDK